MFHDDDFYDARHQIYSLKCCCTLPPFTSNLASSHFDGPKFAGALLDAPVLSVGIPKNVFNLSSPSAS